MGREGFQPSLSQRTSQNELTENDIVFFHITKGKRPASYFVGKKKKATLQSMLFHLKFGRQHLSLLRGEARGEVNYKVMKDCTLEQA